MLKDIAVHLDGTERDATRLDHAAMLADWFEAELTVLFTNLIEIGYIAADPVGASVEIVADAIDEARSAGDAAEARIRERIEALNRPCQLIRHDGTDGELREHAARLARLTDLFLAGRPLGPEDNGWPSLFQSTLFSGGRSVYMVPPDRAPQPPRTILVGWRDGRETTRALTEALPFLRKADRVILASVGIGAEDAGAPEIVRHLERHGVAAQFRSLPTGGRVSETLLAECAAEKVDLLVIGAFGHSRFWEWVLGGTTRNILTVSAIPVLLAH
ncbi:universal stress protein [Aureimonas frigidaquae]|uniref:Universal stress protein UspA-like protein n=1 Tax=Aureimonas frigidaquae TaxID=424757 RepID=A0A0P0Z0E7_9HYPH|nr:universal stress protein [Aureimonas frigidaquae]BAT27356.1 universal stress protein UspA-like protein [Aureimonas frigidaquae]